MPKGTRSFAVVMHHIPGPGDVHWYWVVYGLTPTVDHLDEASSGVGLLGTNSVNGRNEYTPPCSKGPGAKAYTITVYALSAVPTFPSGTAVSRQVVANPDAGLTAGAATAACPATTGSCPPAVPAEGRARAHR